MSDLTRAHIRLTGKVQGVGYRAFAQRTAQELALSGYVVNLPDGSVEVDAEGDREQIERFVEQLRLGPPRSRVEKLEIQWKPYSGQFPNFKARL